MKKGRKGISNKPKMSIAVAAGFVGLTALIGSLFLCGPFSNVLRTDKPSELFTEITESGSPEGTIESIFAEGDGEYYAGDVVPVNTDSLADMTEVTAASENEDYGDVEYSTCNTESGRTLTATAVPREGYKLEHWKVDNKIAYSLGDNTEVTVTDISQNMALDAVFGPDSEDAPEELVSNSSVAGASTDTAKYQVFTVVDPDCIPSGKTASDIGIVSGGFSANQPAQTQINATAKTGYRFDHWHIVINYTDKNGTWHTYMDYDLESNPYTIYTTVDTEDKNIKSYKAMCYAWIVPNEPSVSVVSVTPYPDAATVTHNGTTVTGAPVRIDKSKDIVVKAGTGYKLSQAYYTGTDGVTHTLTPASPTDTTTITIPTSGINEDVYLHVEAVKDAYTVTCVDDPITGGDSELSYTDGSSTVTKKEQLEVPSGKDVTITATPYTGFEFDCFLSATGTVIPETDNGNGSYSITLTGVAKDQTVTAKYIKNTVKVTIVPSHSGGFGGGGNVSYNGGTATPVQATYDYHPKTETSFTIEAIPNTVDNYDFKYWEDDKGNLYNDRVLTITGLREDRTYVAVFTQQHEVTVVIEPSPKEGGTVQYNDETPVSTTKAYIYGRRRETGFTLTAKAKAGYVFQYWTDNKGTTYNKDIIRISNLNEDRVYTAFFTPEENAYTVAVTADPISGGSTEIMYTDDDGAEIRSGGQLQIPEGKDVIITAKATEGYVFDCFLMPTGTEMAGTQMTDGSYSLTINNLSHDQAITARFIKDSVTVTVVTTPAEGGTAQYNDGTFAGGTATYEYHPKTESSFRLTAKANTEQGYTFKYWEDGSGNVFTNETFVVSGLKEDKTYTAVFVQSAQQVTVVIEPSPAEGGTVQYNNEAPVSKATSYIYNKAAETGFTLKAEVKPGYTFQYWIDDKGNTYTKSSVRITNVNEDSVFTAFFVNEEEEGGLRVVASPPSGGHVRKKVLKNGKYKITAEPNEGWYFVGWKKDDRKGEKKGYVSKAKSLKVKDEDITYIGCFEKDENYSRNTDIISEHFYDEKREFTEPNYSVTRQTIEGLAAAAVSYDRLRYGNDLPGLHAYGAVKSVENYYKEKLNDSDFSFARGILTTTEDEVIGTSNIKDIDPLMNSAKNITLDKFGERYDSEVVAAVYTEPPEDFDGEVRTYLWRNTDTSINDNIYVMYRNSGSGYKEMAAVVDDDGTVRFTLEDALTGTEFALIRVNIEDNVQSKKD
ncbi:Listeria/Bacterioides repeat-containing protein [Butyrivibrio sp. ob235]|uniref:InlB B-repeat-containing protein n=1 Tax=Butyrivibrio sp. ob235 TaxID=1761780 RepID=UPI0008C1E7C9|nr:hypothetical protein [Butyrivibrio sp. ob235]SEL90146.1 Listeria/Bacterioides repeat-containing protein [Butyrivibrio sp. ob235]